MLKLTTSSALDFVLKYDNQATKHRLALAMDIKTIYPYLNETRPMSSKSARLFMEIYPEIQVIDSPLFVGKNGVDYKLGTLILPTK